MSLKYREILIQEEGSYSSVYGGYYGFEISCKSVTVGQPCESKFKLLRI